MAVLIFLIFPELPARTEYRYEKVGSPNLPNGPKKGVQSKELSEKVRNIIDSPTVRLSEWHRPE